MKYRQSGMPDEKMWDTFFNPQEILTQLDINENINMLLDIGCGYGTFLIPASKLIQGEVVGIDIDQSMIDVCRNKIREQDIDNIALISGDIANDQTIGELEQYKGVIDYITLFNILHCEQPMPLLKAAFNILRDNGYVGVIHWKYEETPRGPTMEIRPTPEKLIDWATAIGFVLDKYVELPPYHFGLVFRKSIGESK